MIFSLQSRFATSIISSGRLWFFIIALAVYLFCFLSSYVHDPSLTVSPAYANAFPKPNAVFRKEKFSKDHVPIVNKTDLLHPIDIVSITRNVTEFENNTEKNTTYNKKEITFVDLDKMEPPFKFLYEKLTLVTSFSQNHFQEGIGFIGSAQQHMPNTPIIVYDLGLQEQSVNQLVLNEFGVIYYGDASIRFKKPLFELLPDCVGHHGFLGRIRCFDPKVPLKSPFGCHHDYRLTRNDMYGKIGVNKTEYYNANFSSPAFCGGLMLVVNSTTVQSKIMKPWLKCAMDVTCIAPPGASLQNHRFDQSALSLTVFKNLRGEWTLDNDPTPHHDDVVSILRGTKGANWHPKSCL